MMYNPSPVRLNVADLGPWPTLLELPAYKGKCDAQEEYIERNLSLEEIKAKIGPNIGEFMGFMFSSIAGLKEECLIEDIHELANRIAKKYQHLQNPTHQVIEIDWTFSDFKPGDTQIHYAVFTRREIREGIFIEPEQESNDV